MNMFRNELFYEHYDSVKVLFVIFFYSFFMYTFFYFLIFRMQTVKKFFGKINTFWEKIIKTKYFEKIFKFLPQNFFVFILFIISIFTIFTYNFSGVDYYTVYFLKEADNNIGPITEKTELKIAHIKYSKKIDKMCFKVGTYARENTSNVTFKITNNNQVIFSEKIATSTLKDGENLCMDVSLNAGDLNDYTITVIPSSDSTEANSITIFSNKKTGNVSLSLLKYQSNNLTFFKTLVIMFSIAIFLIINYIINTKKLNENKFLLLTLSFIIPILFIIPPLSVPDEAYHFYKAYGISEVSIKSSIGSELSNHSLEVPKSIKCIDYSNINNYNKVQNINDIASCLTESSNTSIENHHIDNNAILGYIPQAIGIKVGDTLSNSPLVIFYFGRVFSLIFSFSIVYLAIKITPKHKTLFLLCSTMMMFIQQMISYSYDSVLHSVILLFIASSLKLIYSKEEIKFKEFIIPILCLFVMLNVKIVYLPLAVMILFIPKDKCKKKYQYIILTIISSIILWKGLDYILSIGYNNSSSSVMGGYGIKQLNYILSNPLKIFDIIINTYKNYFIFYLEGLVGFFGWFAFRVDRIYILVYFLLFLYAFLGEKSSLKKNYRIILTITNLIIIVGIFVAMYLFWSDYKLLYVEGVQGRYFIPIIVSLLIGLIPDKNKIKVNKNIIYSSITILLLQMILLLIIGYY